MHGRRSRAQHAQQRMPCGNATAPTGRAGRMARVAQHSAALVAWAGSFRAAGRLRSLLSNGGHFGSGQASHGCQQGGACKGEGGQETVTTWLAQLLARWVQPPGDLARAGSCSGHHTASHRISLPSSASAPLTPGGCDGRQHETADALHAEGKLVQRPVRAASTGASPRHAPRRGRRHDHSAAPGRLDARPPSRRHLVEQLPLTWFRMVPSTSR